MIPSGSLVLLDTNILVHLVRQKGVGAQVEADHSLASRPDRPLISFVTMAEMHALALKFGWGRRTQAALRDLLEHLVVVHIHQGDILEHYARIDHHSEKVVKPARPMGQNDMWIAATAAALSAVLVTTDNDFDHLAPTFFQCVKVDAKTGESRWAG